MTPKLFEGRNTLKSSSPTNQQYQIHINHNISTKQIPEFILPHIRIKTLHHEAFPSHDTYELNIHHMSQLAQVSTK